MKKTLLALVAAAALPFAAHAGDLRYNYVEGGYAADHFNGLPNADGFGLNGSVGLGDDFSLFGGWSRQKFDNTGVHFNDWNAGVGFHHPLNDTTHLVANLGYRSLDTNAGGGGNVHSYTGEVGVRSQLGSNFEGWALGGYEDGKNVNGEFYGKLGGQVKFGKNWGLVGEAKMSHDQKEYFVGPRFSF
jgi:Ax21 family sulfation-dependent quorum factor